ncbi:MAG: hypothetical protein QMD44_07440 [Thermodesulfovibrionales bacterium]|nr:hypothetical protein [Thermodesulfovibrionales bacterium]
MKKLLFALALIAALTTSSLGLAADNPQQGTPQCPCPCCQQSAK